jgi:hypothetical protein
MPRAEGPAPAPIVCCVASRMAKSVARGWQRRSWVGEDCRRRGKLHGQRRPFPCPDPIARGEGGIVLPTRWNQILPLALERNNRHSQAEDP